MGRYAVIYWKNLNKDKITVKEFDDEAEMVEYAENKKLSGYGVIVADESSQNMMREKSYIVRHYGAYFIFRYLAIYFGLILIVLIIVIFLMLKGKGI